MAKRKLGILHPGQMGISIAASALNSGCEVYWASEDRSRETHQRASRFKLHDVRTLAEMCDTCSALVSVCPPHAAEDVAQQVAAQAFTGLYVDANAVSPQRVIRIGTIVGAAGATFVDGGIIGGPAWEPGCTWLYLSGSHALAIADCFSAGPLQTDVIGETIGRASALKMCYAAYTKGTTALLAAIMAAAESLGVRQNLEQQWDRNWAGFAAGTTKRVRRVTAKAWRFSGEMDEIASTLEAEGLPGGFHQAAGILYQRLAHYKDAAAVPTLEEVLEALTEISEAST
jgi:3-hydroxyisobutyrate dehydrogenase-like beta-hydroxyacid dehydrogenase